MTDKNTGRQSPVNMEDENISEEWIGERLRAVMEPANNVLKADGVHIQAIALVGAKKVGKSSLIRQIVSLNTLRLPPLFFEETRNIVLRHSHLYSI